MLTTNTGDTQPGRPATMTAQPGTVPTGQPAVDLADELMDIVFTMEPLSATLLGVPGHDDRLADTSTQAHASARQSLLGVAERAEAAARDSDVDVTLAVVAQQARARID